VALAILFEAPALTGAGLSAHGMVGARALLPGLCRLDVPAQPIAASKVLPGVSRPIRPRADAREGLQAVPSRIYQQLRRAAVLPSAECQLITGPCIGEIAFIPLSALTGTCQTYQTYP